MPQSEGTPKTLPLIENIRDNSFFAHLTVRITRLINPTGQAYLQSGRKRALDIIGTIVVMPILLPIIAGGAIAVKLEDGGPIFYVAKVVGRQEEEFGMLKLRSMTPDADKIRQSNGEEIFQKQENDLRITKVGKIIRRLSIDEFPQLINILRGEMSLVGPRPVFQRTIDFQRKLDDLSDVYPEWLHGYYLTRPGAIGPKMTVGRGDVTHSIENLRSGIEAETFYLTHASLGEDIKQLVKGIGTIISQKGAY